jgi:hypothetical protein
MARIMVDKQDLQGESRTLPVGNLYSAKGGSDTIISLSNCNIYIFSIWHANCFLFVCVDVGAREK